jgi:hypothetical protein
VVYLSAVACVVLFVVAFERAGIVPVASRAVETGRDAMQTLAATDVSDNQKEKLVQAAAVKLLGAFASLSLRGVATLAISVLPGLGFQLGGLVPLDATLSLLASWPAIVVASLVMTGVYVARRPAK